MSNGDNVTNSLVPNRDLPPQGQPTSPYVQRSTLYGDASVQSLIGSRLLALADEGSYFVATNPTPGTPIAGKAAPTTLADTAALISFFNGNPASSKKRMYLDFILLMVTAAGTSSTNFNLAVKGDTGNDRYTSGGSVITPVNPNMDSAAAAAVKMRFGDLTIAAATPSARLLHRIIARTVIKVIGDLYLLTFGDSSPAAPGMPLEGTLQLERHIHCPPVIVGPQGSLLVHEFAAAQAAAASYEFVAGWWER